VRRPPLRLTRSVTKIYGALLEFTGLTLDMTETLSIVSLSTDWPNPILQSLSKRWSPRRPTGGVSSCRDPHAARAATAWVRSPRSAVMVFRPRGAACGASNRGRPDWRQRLVGDDDVRAISHRIFGGEPKLR